MKAESDFQGLQFSRIMGPCLVKQRGGDLVRVLFCYFYQLGQAFRQPVAKVAIL